MEPGDISVGRRPPRALRRAMKRAATPTRSTKTRRPRATIRERQRMAQVNQAFDELRRVVPRGHVTECQRLSKIATLRLAISYIRAMDRILGRAVTDNDQDQRSMLLFGSNLPLDSPSCPTPFAYETACPALNEDSWLFSNFFDHDS